MKRPQLIDLEFAILLFLVAGGFIYSALRGVFALLSRLNSGGSVNENLTV